MIKLGKTKYHTQWGDLTANQIIKKLQKLGLTKHNRTLKCTYCTIDVKFAGTTVRLFFSKRGRNGHWNGLLTTDLSLSFLKAYRTYTTRWTTEVAYYDKFIIMRSDSKFISDYQDVTFLLLISTLHNNMVVMPSFYLNVHTNRYQKVYILSVLALFFYFQ